VVAVSEGALGEVVGPVWASLLVQWPATLEAAAVEVVVVEVPVVAVVVVEVAVVVEVVEVALVAPSPSSLEADPSSEAVPSPWGLRQHPCCSCSCNCTAVRVGSHHLLSL